MGVETALTVGSMAAQGIGAGMSFAQASKQKKLMNEAQRAAEQATAAARAKLGVNYFEQLAVPMEAYEKEREALISAGAQAMQAATESERGAAAAAGRVQMAQTEAQAGQRAAMAGELSGLQKLTAEEESRLAGLRADLDISEAAANRLDAQRARERRAQAIQQGFAGVTGMIESGAPLINLYSTQRGEGPLGEGAKLASTAAGLTGVTKGAMTGATTGTSTDITGVEKIGGKSEEEIGSMTPDEYKKFIEGLTPEDQSKLSKYVLNMMNPFSIK